MAGRPEINQTLQRNVAPVLPIEPFAQQQDWAVWLQANHGSAVGVWLRPAKAETRARKIAQFVQMLERHEKIHP